MRMRRHGRLWVPEAPQLMLNRHKPIRGVRQGISVSGRWKELALIHARTGDVVRRVGPFPNLILNRGLDLLGTAGSLGLTVSVNSNSVFYQCVVGTGNTPPEVTDTELESEIGRTSNSGGFAGETLLVEDNTRWRATKTWVFGTAEANGNIAEIGCGNSSGLLTRQLVRDQLGNPTTLTKTPEYQLRCIYEFSIWLPRGDDVYEMDIDGAPVEVTSRLGSFSTWDSAADLSSGPSTQATNGNRLSTDPIGPEGSNLTANSVIASSAANYSYVPGSYQRESYAIWTASIANAGPYISFSLGSASNGRTFKVDIGGDGGIQKTSDERFVLEWTRLWGRHEA